jgi:Na+-transporting NADH:ubiquinone oxidoreductase subunit NqrB
MWNWLNNTDTGRAVRSYVISFVTVILGLFIADGADIFAVSSTDLKAWLAAGLAAVLPVIITALNPNDPRYGIKNNA